MFAALALGVLLTTSAPADAHHGGGHRYVATSGSDAGLSDCLDELAPCRTIQYAINQAADEDWIHVAAGTYTESLTIAGKSLIIAGFDVPLGADGGTIIQACAVPQLDASCPAGQGEATRVITVEAASLALENLVVRHGRAQDDHGGGIRVNGGDLSLMNVLLRDNITQYLGGAIYHQRIESNAVAGLTIRGGELTGNRASNGGRAQQRGGHGRRDSPRGNLDG